MNRVAVITATRAEFGLLLPVLRELRKNEDSDFHVDLVVTGTHLSDQYGMTIQEIRNSGERIDHVISIPVDSTDAVAISSNQAQTLTEFTRLFTEVKYQGIVLLGDRYETLAIAIAAGNTRTPIFHLCGGDTTEGAIDEWIRHSITKIAYLHFVTNEQSRKRVIQLGEDPSRVFNYGSTSIDNVLSLANMGKEEALESIGMKDCKYALCTYHPVTMSDDDVEHQIENFLEAIEHFSDIQFIVTKSNADQGGVVINNILDKANNTIENVHVFASLGVRRYLSLMRHAEFVLGNSSSGIIETPAFRVPTVNIGDRQRGRLQAKNIVNCGSSAENIMEAITIARSQGHKKVCQTVVNPYGDGFASRKIANRIYKTINAGRIDLKKKFFDLDRE